MPEENQEDQKHPSQEINENRERIQSFVDEFEALAEKYGIEKYLATVYFDNERPIMLWRPNDLNSACKTAKYLHANLHQQVMMAIGDVVPPNEDAERQIAQAR